MYNLFLHSPLVAVELLWTAVKLRVHVWHLREKVNGDKRDQKTKGNQRLLKEKEGRDMCVYVVSMYDVQISPELFGTVVRASCSQSIDPWLRSLHM